jgi:hypothetical protein
VIEIFAFSIASSIDGKNSSPLLRIVIRLPV